MDGTYQIAAPGQPKKLYKSDLFNIVENFIFSKNRTAQSAMLIFTRFVNQENIHAEFVCRRAELARRFGCSERYASRLIRLLVRHDLIEIIKDSWSFLKNTYVRTYKLTNKSIRILRKTLMKLEGEQKVAIGSHGASTIVDLSADQNHASFQEQISLKNELNAFDESMYTKNKPNKINKKQKRVSTKHYACKPESYEIAKILTDDYLGFFKEFKERVMFCKMIGKAVDEKGLVEVNDLLTAVGQNYLCHYERRVEIYERLRGPLKQ